jgi:hypothetical protein
MLTPLIPLLDEIEAASKDYTPGVAYDTRWYEWTLKLAAICRKAFRPPEELAQELEIARPEIEAAKEHLRAERQFLADAPGILALADSLLSLAVHRGEGPHLELWKAEAEAAIAGIRRLPKARS